MEISKNIYKEIARWIQKQLDKHISWEQIFLANKDSQDALAQFLKHQEEDNDWPRLTIGEWTEIVRQVQEEKMSQKRLIDDQGATVIRGGNENNEIKIPFEEGSAWQTYRRTLSHKGFSKGTIDLIEDAAIRTLRNLSRDTREIGTVKGLVVGNVQSGKTANMAALMAMAADHGWNMFIILSGMMNNLKEQTERRIISDLECVELDWIPIHDPKARCPYNCSIRKLDLSKTAKKRYLTVCIKNYKRLENLLNWLNYQNAPKENLRLLIIDDEADQASINTSTEEERTKINRLILDLVNNRNAKHEESPSPAAAINYIGYTATPYANVLNEPPGKESLYPKNFITALPVSDEYFGPQQIFGLVGDDADFPKFTGLNIIRNISPTEVGEIDDIHEGNSKTIPQSLVDSICWFLCGVASMRYSGYDKPISMLVHTSRDKKHHEELRSAITEWFDGTSKECKIKHCQVIWSKETASFTEKDFNNGYPDYGKIRGKARINPLPDFEQILPYLKDMLDAGLTHILVNSDNQCLQYSRGVHLCVDNSAKNNDDSVQLRIMYPEGNEKLKVAPAFLVIGGNTLSRGLTLEGLISTFFLRPATCSDTLMQMGRWFGYRKGYELLPRIWMPQDIKEKFIFMAEMDQKLRDEIRFMEISGTSPEDCGPKIMASPSSKFLRIVADNKQQASVGAEYDFTGHTTETGVFSNKTEDLETNLETTKQFVISLGSPADTANNPYAKSNLVWRDVPWSSIRKYLANYKYSERLKGFKELDKFLEWFDDKTEKKEYGTWNVILAGVKGTGEHNRWDVSENISIYKVSRTKITPDREDDTLNIRVLRSFNDFLSDIPVADSDSQKLEQMRKVNHTLIALNELRDKLGMRYIPQLVIYIIDKDSQPLNEDAKTRFPLNAKKDVAGFSINIPGYRNNRSAITSITIDIPSKNQFVE